MKLEDNQTRVAVFVAESDHHGYTRHPAALMPRADKAGLAKP
jgi:hypothetical protein